MALLNNCISTNCLLFPPVRNNWCIDSLTSTVNAPVITHQREYLIHSISIRDDTVLGLNQNFNLRKFDNIFGPFLENDVSVGIRQVDSVEVPPVVVRRSRAYVSNVVMWREVIARKRRFAGIDLQTET